jgi:hypothetical protein
MFLTQYYKKMFLATAGNMFLVPATRSDTIRHLQTLAVQVAAAAYVLGGRSLLLPAAVC